jgi:carboxypeptidase Q
MNARQGLPFAAVSLVCLLCAPALRPAGEPGETYEDIAQALLTKGLTEQGAFDVLSRICGVGPRLTGSPQAAAAVDLAQEIMRGLGFDRVWTEPVEVGHWIRGDEEARLVSAAGGSVPLAACALGGSVATPGDGISAEVLEVHSFDELKEAGDRAGGKIVFFDRAWDQSLPETFAGYGPMAQQRDQAAIQAGRAGGVAAVVRSASTGHDDLPHTGLMHYEPGVVKVPAAALSPLAADRLEEALKLDPRARLYLRLGCRTEAPVMSANVIGEIRGTEKPEEVILLGGHLDSWDLAPGAHDDGAGCSQAVEAVRLIRGLGLRPRRTIRAVLFMDEENGGTGGRAYAAAELRKQERHLAAIESDRGGFLPLGMGLGTIASYPRFAKYLPLLRLVGLFWLRPGGGGVDVGPLAGQGVVLGGLVPDSQRYFDVHHSAADVLAAVNPRQLELGAVAMAVLAYVLAEDGI